MSSASKRKLSNMESPPHKKAKHNQDEMKIVVIGKEQKSFPSTLLSNVPYFEAKLSKKWDNNHNDDTIQISIQDSFIFSIHDLSTLLSCFNKDKFVIPHHLYPQTTFLSLMQCANFFCVNRMMDEEILINYYKHCTVKVISIDTLKKWKSSNIPQIVQFASKMLIQRQSMTLQEIANALRTCRQKLIWSRTVQISARKSEVQCHRCDESVLKGFECAIDLLLENYEEGCNLNKIIMALKSCINTIKNQLCYIGQLSRTCQGNQILCALLKLLFYFTTYDKYFKMIFEPIVSLMVAFCEDNKLRNRFDLEVKKLWMDVVVYVFKASHDSYHQLIVKVIDKTLDVFVEDEERMKEIFELVNNENGHRLALGIMKYDLRNAGCKIMLQQKYHSFCSKFFNPIKLNVIDNNNTNK